MSGLSAPKTVLLFAGQGSHFSKMGRAAFDADLVFRERLFYADRCVRRLTGVNLIDTIFGPGDAWLNDLSVTHPAIFAQQWATAESLKARGMQPDACVGASLGEFVALAHTGASGFDQTLELIVGQARNAKDILAPGGMLTVLESAEFFRNNPAAFADCTLAADNFHRHIVVSGTRAAIDACRRALEGVNVSSFLLNIPFGFHSPAVAAMRPAFMAIADQIELRTPACPIYGCSLAGRTLVPDAQHLWRIVEAPILFSKTIEQIEKDFDRPRYVDCSPSGTLANFLHYLLGPQHKSRIVALNSFSAADLAPAPLSQTS